MGVAGPLEIAPEFAAGACALSRRKATRAQARDIEAGLAVISTLAPHDVGQAVIVHDGRVLAVEAAEGTDAMIGRISALRAAGRLRAKAPSGVLVKAAKPGQEMRMDMPVIGAQTVRMCAENGLAGIAVARAEVLVATPDEVRAAADDAGLFVAVAERAEPSA